MQRPPPPELADFLAPFPDEVVGVALGLRAGVLEVIPHAHEIVWDATNAVSIVHGASERWTTDGITHIAIYARHVNLGFNDGATLDDPRRVLIGTGSRIRHHSFHQLVDVTRADWLPVYVMAAVRQAGHDRSLGDGRTTVRRSRGPKRRPGSS